jgi:hypothetical protein
MEGRQCRTPYRLSFVRLRVAELKSYSLFLLPLTIFLWSHQLGVILTFMWHVLDALMCFGTLAP